MPFSPHRIVRYTFLPYFMIFSWYFTYQTNSSLYVQAVQIFAFFVHSFFAPTCAWNIDYYYYYIFITLRKKSIFATQNEMIRDTEPSYYGQKKDAFFATPNCKIHVSTLFYDFFMIFYLSNKFFVICSSGTNFCIFCSFVFCTDVCVKHRLLLPHFYYAQKKEYFCHTERTNTVL